MANNVGTAYVTVMPSMRGFSSEVSKGFGSASASASKAFGASNIGGEASKSFSKGFSAKAGVVIGAVSSITSSALGVISSGLSGAISRVDTLNNYPKVMSSLGYSSKEASKSISTISKALDGLPSSTNGVASMVQSLAPLSSSLSEATDLGLALNNMMLASGASTSDVSRAMTQYTQILSKGKPEMQDWRTLQEVMPGQLNQVAQAMLGEGKSSTDLYDALKAGKVSMGDFNKAVLELNTKGGKGFKSFQDQAKNATQGIQTALDNVQNRINNAISKVIGAIGAENISGAINSISSQFVPMAEAVAGVVSDVKKYLGGLWDALKDNGTISSLVGAFETLRDAVKGAFEGMPNWSEVVPPETVASVVKGIGDQLSRFVDVMRGVVSWVQQNANVIAPLVTAIAGGLAAFKLIAPVSGIVSTVTGTLSTFGGVAEGITSTVSLLGTNFAAMVSKVGLLKALPMFFAGMANPVTVAIVAIAALAAGLAYFFTQTEQGQAALAAISEAFTSQVLPALQPVGESLQQLGTQLMGLIGQVAAQLAPLLPVIASLVTQIGTVISNVLTFAIQNILPVITQVIGTVLTLAQQAIPFVVAAITTVIGVITTVIGVISQVLAVVIPVVTQIYSTVASAISGVVSFFANLASSIGSAISAAVTIVSSLFSCIGQAMSGPLNAAKSVVSTALNGIKSAFNVLNSVRSTVANVFNGVKNAIMTPINKAKSLVKSAIDAIAGIFKGASFKLPSIKLPHFSVKGKFSLNPPSVPSIGIDWYAKGGVFDGPSVIGIGEAGREAALPLNDRTYAEIAKGISTQGGTSNSVVINLNYSKDADANQMVRDIAAGLRRMQMTGA